ncbi:hypothetical protein D3C75_1126440 [compost metagenome]
MFLQCLQSPGAVLSRAKAAEPACILDVPKQFLHAVYHLDQMNVFSGNPPVMLGHAKRQAHLGKNVRYGIPAVSKEFLKRRERTIGNQAEALEKGFTLYFQGINNYPVEVKYYCVIHYSAPLFCGFPSGFF